MKKKKQYLGLDNPQEHLKKLQSSFDAIDRYMIAIGMDFKFYLDSNFADSEIYNLRDRIIYRLRATYIHFRIIMNLLSSMDQELTEIHRQRGGSSTSDLHTHFYRREIDISAIADSILFHLISGFDYVSSLVSFIIGKQKKLKWVGLAKSSRDSSNDFSKDPLARIIDTLDRELVGKLYDHRSTVIHLKNEARPTSFSIDLMNGKVTSKIIASSDFTRKFHVLRKKVQDNDLSLIYTMMWLLNESTEAIIKIQFGLKDFMERKKTNKKPFMFFKGPDGEVLPPSTTYWNRNN